MTGAEHLVAAEAALSMAEATDTTVVDYESMALALQIAQVHATLAMAYAIARVAEVAR